MEGLLVFSGGKFEEEEGESGRFYQPLAECVGSLPKVGNRGASHTGNRNKLYAFLFLSLPRISLILLPCSIQMDRMPRQSGIIASMLLS
jgi:hypothetical protein